MHRIYHDTVYGQKCEDDQELFGRLILEINQAGLSWSTILKKSESIRSAYVNFNIQQIADFDDTKIKALMKDSGIIRHRGKIKAIIYNAQQVLKIQEQYHSFFEWIEEKGEITLDEWIKVFKKSFKFVGKEIVKEFLMGTGFIEGAHEPACPMYTKLIP
tara:strand:- start:236 stop:712 length:477 start_codon:yes stop_codon:yes gene_type:complete